MERRSFIKNSLFALFSTAITSNKALAKIASTLNSDSLKIMLYLVQMNSGVWRVKATKWVDLPKKRLKRCEVKPETFKLLDIVDYDIANTRKLELCKEYNCTEKFRPIRIKENIENGKKAISHPNYLNYRNSDKFKVNMVNLHKIGGKYGGKIASITKKENGFDYRAISLKGAEVMKNMSYEKRLEYADRARKIHKGRKRSDEVKSKISESKKGKPSHNKGKIFSNEVRMNMSISAKNRKYTEEGLIKRKEQFEKIRVKKGFKHSEKSKKVMSELKKGNKNCVGRILSQETKEKISKSNTGKKRDSREVNLYSFELNYFIGKFRSYTDAALFVGANPECMRLTTTGKRKHTKGFYAKLIN